MSGIIEFRAKRQGSGTVDGDLFDVDPLRDAFGRFASGCTARFIDSDGTKVDDYPYGQRVEIEQTTDGGANWTRRFAGFVSDSTRTTRDGLTQAKVDLVAYDHLLRRRKVYKDYSSTTVSSILNDLITNFTSVTWNASNVNVQNDNSIDLALRGKRVDEAIDELAAESADENWGVNRDLEFFFEQQDTNRANPIGDADVITHDLPDEGKRAINRFKLFYDSNSDGTASSFVEVEDREAQQDLKNKLNAPRRVVISDSDTFLEISTEAEAERVARQHLDERSVIQTGTITLPLGRFNTESGDVFSLTISDANISEKDFRVAEIDYNWQAGTTSLTIAENRGANIDDLLVNLSDSLSNVRARDASTAASGTRYLDFQNGVTMSLSATVTTRTFGDGFTLGQSQLGQGTSDQLGGQISSTGSVSVDTKKVTRSLLNMARDVWQDGNSAFTDNTHIGVGDDDTAATISDNSLQSQIARRSLDKFGAGSNAEDFEWVGEVGPGGNIADANDIEEFMFFDAATGNNGYARLTMPATAVDASTKVTFHVVATIDVDTSEQGVVTSKGQERLRDLLVGESNHEPTDMVYGTGTTDAAESDTSLGSKKHEDTIDKTSDGSTGITDIIERITSGDADTTNISELGYENSSNELLARITFEAIPNDVVLESNYKFKASNA